MQKYNTQSHSWEKCKKYFNRKRVFFFNVIKLKRSLNEQICLAKNTKKYAGTRECGIAPLIGVTPIFALSFFGNDFGKKMQSCQRGKNIFYFKISESVGITFESSLILTWKYLSEIISWSCVLRNQVLLIVQTGFSPI